MPLSDEKSFFKPIFQSAALRDFRRALLRWYDEHGRDLPWRTTRDPYRIWVSEIMLQQTRVAAVLEHYRIFLERFPNSRRWPQPLRVQYSPSGVAWATTGVPA